MAKPKKFEEIECKFLEVDVPELTKKLVKLGAKKKFNTLFRRYTFDFPDLRLHKQYSWVRIRDEGDKVTLTYKQRQGVKDGQNDTGMTEIEVSVSNFEDTAALLRAIGMKEKFYEENRRTAYELDGSEVVIDEWPLIPAYAEIEAADWKTVDAVAQKLGFDLADKCIFSTLQVYKRYGIDEMAYQILTFDKQVKK